MRVIVLIALLMPAVVAARSRADQAVQGVFQARDPSLRSMTLMHRAQVAPELDLVVAYGGHGPWQPGMPVQSGPERMGLFLQDRGLPELVYALAMEPLPCASASGLERAGDAEVIFSCSFEKSNRQPHEKFVYDARAKALVGRVSYQPFEMVRLFPAPDGAVVVAFDGRRLVGVELKAQRDPQLRLMSESEAIPWTRRVELQESWAGDPSNKILRVEPARFKPFAFGPGSRFWLTEIRERDDPAHGQLILQEDTGGRWKRHLMPRTSPADFARLRPEQHDNIGVLFDNDENIGPHQVVGDTLWFGKAFYDSEGLSGVGGIGTFDAVSKAFRMIEPAELRDWSVEALHVGSDAVWMCLASHQEYDDGNGGLVRYDLATGAIRRVALPYIGRHLTRVGDVVLVATETGLTIVSGDEVRHWFIDVLRDGRLRLVERLPPRGQGVSAP